MAALLSLVAILHCPARAAEPACPDSGRPPLLLPRLKAALAAKTPILIVALGSSSTQGAGASTPAHAYPAMLQQTLSDELPNAHVAVVNRGIGGQDAAEEMARLEQDAIALHPHVIIWQVGANGALRGADPTMFRSIVAAGVQRMKAAGADVVLMDNQRAPRILGKPKHMLIDQALADAALAEGAALFSRGGLMDSWQRDGFAPDNFIGPDGLHHNDLGYRCLAQALADAMLAGLGPSMMATARTGAR